MPATVETKAKIIFDVDNRAQQALKKAGQEMEALQKRTQRMQSTFKTMRNAGVIAFGAISIGMGKAISKARDFEEETNKFNVVFKDVSDGAEKMADRLNESYGLSILQSKRLLSSTGDILTGFGFTGKSALDLSSRVNTLAVDLASFTNAQGGATAVSNALTKALLGERESLKTYGIAIQDADVKAELLAQGMDKLTGEALRQAKAQVTLDLAFRQSKNAIGDYARSTGTLTQTQVELRKSIEDIQISIGTQLAPILNDMLKQILPILEKTAEWIEQNPQLTKVILVSVAGLTALVTVLGIIGLAIPAVVAGITAMGTAFSAVFAGSVWGLIIAGSVLIANNLKDIIGVLFDVEITWKDVWNGMKDTVSSIADFIIDKITTIKRGFDDLIGNRIGSFIKNVKGGAVELAGDVINAVGINPPDGGVSQNGGQTVNFDFSGANITDKNQFMDQIKADLGRGLKLNEVGI